MGGKEQKTSVYVLEGVGGVHMAAYTFRANRQEHVNTGKGKSWGQMESQGWELSEKWADSCGEVVSVFLGVGGFFAFFFLRQFKIGSFSFLSSIKFQWHLHIIIKVFIVKF